MPQLDTSLLTAALVGYQQQLRDVDARIGQMKKTLGGRRALANPEGGGGDIPSPFVKPRRRRMSAAGRRRIAEAQRRRWAAYRKGKAK